jgi:hypothetical protein
VVIGKQRPRQLHLLEVVETVDALRLRFRLAQRRQQHGGQDRNNGNDHQQLDEGEGQGKQAMR